MKTLTIGSITIFIYIFYSFFDVALLGKIKFFSEKIFFLARILFQAKMLHRYTQKKLKKVLTYRNFSSSICL